MDVSTSLSVVQTVLKIMELPIWKEIGLVLQVDTEVKKLKDTVSTINDFLLDADELERQQLGGWSHVEHGRLQRLKEALYQAEDLFDEVTTLAHQKQLKTDNQLCKEVRRFFSCSNQLPSAFTWTSEIKRIREMLENIVNDNNQVFALRQPVAHEARLNQTDSSSFICEEDVIIGRDEDEQRVIDMIVDTTIVEDVSFINIVGIGGLGKTTLAQLVYNDGRIDREFSLKMWVCVSDDFNDKALLGKILAAATKVANVGGLSLDLLQQQLRQQLEGKKYLLVLDDIWNEDVNEWRKLRNMLIRGARGSRVVVTTRSRGVAEIVGGQTHELKGLSEKDSWNLFEKMTLEPGQHQMEDHLVEIGKEIIKKCASVPLALRVVGSLLRGQSESRWRYFKNIDLANIEQDNNGIIPVLKISYYYLPYHLKSCFTYSATFPKDYKILKENLICLWMAQGFIRPYVGQSLEETGEYFKHLLQRCFFQDVEHDESGEIISCKMHDLIHDVAKEVAGIEILSSNYITSQINEKTRHLFADSSVSFKDIVTYTTKMIKMRTLLFEENEPDSSAYYIFSNGYFNVRCHEMRYLRVLDLHMAEIRTLPSSIGNLLLLRYLDLSYNYLTVLPTSFSKLYNLQTLNLRYCKYLEQLPKDMSKLVNLRQLDIYQCFSLRHMPQGVKRMTSLQKLTAFIVGGTNKVGIGIGELRDLKYFTNHTDVMQIRIRNGARYNSAEAREGQCLFNTKHLKNIQILWDEVVHSVRKNDAEATLEALQPCSNLRILLLEGYPGVRFPSWGAEGGSSANLNSCLPNLVEIELKRCNRLMNLPLMSQLLNLKVLKLKKLLELEYVESSNICGDVFFPSLEMLELKKLPKLKGWWKQSSEEESNGEQQEQGSQPRNELLTTSLQSYAFPRLSDLTMVKCNSLRTLPLCPELEVVRIGLSPRSREKGHMNFYDSGWKPVGSRLRPRSRKKIHMNSYDSGWEPVLSIYSPNEFYNVNSALAKVVQRCSKLEFREIKDLEIWTAREMFRSGMVSSIHSLEISSCMELTSLSAPGMWEHFTALESLELNDLGELELEDEDDVNSTSTSCTTSSLLPWIYLSSTLRSLRLHDLRKLVKLPAVMRHLTSLVFLQISFCENLEALPPWINCLQSLQSLVIQKCKRLKSLPEEMFQLTSLEQLVLWDNEELQETWRLIGAHWHKIQRIRNIPSSCPLTCLIHVFYFLLLYFFFFLVFAFFSGRIKIL